MPYRHRMVNWTGTLKALFIGVAVVLWFAVASQCRAETAAVGDQTVLLGNGELLTGSVRRDVNTMIVTTDRGAELRIPDCDILHIGNNVAESFAFLHRAANLSNCHEVLKLAKWALEQGLLDECRVELTRARQLDHSNLEIEIVTERWQQAVARASGEPARQEKNPESPGAAVATSRSERYTQLASTDRFALAAFTKHIQPLLTNQCATAGCHGRGSTNQFALRIPLRGRGFSSSQSIANLQATLPYIDRAQPQSSHLLLTLKNSHAHQKFLTRPGYATFTRLQSWVNSLASAATVDVPAPEESPTEVPAVREPSVVTTASHDDRPDDATPTRDLPLATDGPTSDPYDPEVFNRMIQPE
jgi:hypothetical protein